MGLTHFGSSLQWTFRGTAVFFAVFLLLGFVFQPLIENRDDSVSVASLGAALSSKCEDVQSLFFKE